MNMSRLRTNISFSIQKTPFFVCAFILSLAVSSVSYAQEEVKKKTLEDYMMNNEPAQDALSLPEEKKESVLDRIQKSLDENAKKKEEDRLDTKDVLPNIPSRVTLEIDGFDNASGRRRSTYPDIDEYLDRDLTEDELEDEIRREAFDAAITGLFPLEPDQIKGLLVKYDTTKRIVKEAIHGIPEPQVNVATVSLDPGIPPLAIKTATGHVTTLNILDITGAPWPIQDVSWAGDFEVTEPEEGGHVLRITPLEQAAYGNMSIRLLTLKTPVTVMLRTSKEEVQYRVDARISEYGPFAQAPLIDGGAERVAGNSLITSILDGVPPNGAERLDVSGVDGRTTAYNINGMTYVRTPLTLLSPGWEQSVSSADGLNVYALNQTPVLLLSDKGRFMRAGLKVSKDLLDE